MRPWLRCMVVGVVSIILITTSFNAHVGAQQEALEPLKVVQLGDSYSAGNGARNAAGDRNYHGVKGCYRSPTNWGSQFVASLKERFRVTYINRACSGAIIQDVLEENVMEDVFLDEYRTSCPLPEYPDEEKWIEPVPGICRRVLKPQIDAIDESVDLVLMTIGGNDVNFSDIVTQCFAAGPRDPAGCRNAVNEARGKLDTVKGRLINLLKRIREKLRPDAKVVLVTYPYLSLDINYQLHNRWTNDTYDAAKEIRRLGAEADVRQRSAVKEANDAAGQEYVILYDGTKAIFEGHEPHPEADTRNPDRWLYEFETRIPYEWYHYNPLGHEHLASALANFDPLLALVPERRGMADIDVALVVDTTGSMEGAIAQVRTDLTRLVERLGAMTNSYRVAVVSYRDFPQRTGEAGDYPARVDLPFTSNLTWIQTAINSLTAEGGGDWPETVFSGIQTAINLPWRPGVTKIAIVIGDAPPLSPEPISGLTAQQLVANSIAIDPVQVIGVNLSNLNDNGTMEAIAAGTGGTIISDTSELTTVLSAILDGAARQPFAWLGTAYAGKIGAPVLFDASGSYDPSGMPISRYEWDFNGDGVFDLETTEPTATHVYDTAFEGYVLVRVTGPGGTALASARTVVNEQGYASQGDEEPCPLDENGISIVVDEDGQFLRCTATNLPTTDKEGIIEILGGKVFMPAILK